MMIIMSIGRDYVSELLPPAGLLRWGVTIKMELISTKLGTMSFLAVWLTISV